jgi:hypothetical protein
MALRLGRGATLTLLVTLAAAAGVGAWLAERTTGGPLATSPGGGIGTPVKVGRTFSVGVTSLTYHGSGLVFLRSVTPDSLPAGIRVVGTRAVAFGRGCFSSRPRFPPSDYQLAPLAAAVLKPSQYMCAAVGLRAMREGRFVIPSFTVRYEIGVQGYETKANESVRICASDPVLKRCAAP